MKALARPLTVCALLTALTLTGCGGEDEPAEQAGSSAAGDPTPADADAGKGGKGGKNGPGGEKPKAQKVPADFPAEVPLTDGLVSVAGKEAGTWLVQVEVEAPYEQVRDSAIDQLLGAGFTEETRSDAGESSVMLTATGAGYDVTLTVAATGDASTVLYAVTSA